jgi:hypothetical protein
MSSIRKDHAGRFEEEVRRGADPDMLDEIGLRRPLQPRDLIDLDTVAEAMARKRAADEGPAAETRPSSGPSVDKVTKTMKAAAKRGTKRRLSSRQRAVAEGRGEDFNVM